MYIKYAAVFRKYIYILKNTGLFGISDRNGVGIEKKIRPETETESGLKIHPVLEHFLFVNY